MKTIFSFLSMSLFSFYCYSIHNSEQLYSTSFLKNHKKVQKYLIDEGFKKIIFTTSDNLQLSGLFLSRPYAQYNVIVCSGWLPGKKEGMATFYDLLPVDANIFFFDARGHGESQGSLLWKLWRYGIDEYKDITAAVYWLNNNNTLPIIIAGICSGAFNAAHAIDYIEKHNPDHTIKGLIFDSGWGSITKIIKTAPVGSIKKKIMHCMDCVNHKKSVHHNYLYRAFSYSTECIYSACTYLWIKYLTLPYEQQTNLFTKIEKITVPILFIHSYDDEYADIQDVINLSLLTQHKQCWWIEKSPHAKHHLIHEKIYKEKLIDFIHNVVYKP